MNKNNENKITKSDNYKSCHLLSIDNEAVYAWWIRRHDTGRSNILPTNI